ncbi:MAG TPA: ankyrin repeat domain-containing protein [Thermoanaerobaculia bacterium]|nr:ankyrin repeat domain-containing protein [Thermoanaerobaculia bacterium]
MRAISILGLLTLLAHSAFADQYPKISKLRDHAKEAIEAGSIDAASDIGPLIDMLRVSKDDDDQRHLVDAIVDLGRADGTSPAAVKEYVIAQMTPILLSLASNRSNSTFLRGDSISALREMGAPRAALEQVTAMALKDSDDYVKSRGEILQNYMASMKTDSPAATLKPKSAEGEKDALEYLRMRNMDVSADSLHRAAFEANFEDVKQLLKAGVPVDGAGGDDTPLLAAMTGCTREGETDLVVDVVDLLVTKGADVKRKDDNANTPLITAAQYCGARVVNRLIAAGADVNAMNGSSMTPLMIALVMGRFDAADALVAKGAKLNAQQAEIMKNSVSDARGKAIVAKAVAKPAAKKK